MGRSILALLLRCLRQCGESAELVIWWSRVKALYLITRWICSRLPKVDSLTRFVYSQLVCPLLAGIFKHYDYLQCLFPNLIDMTMKAPWGNWSKGNY